MRRATLSPQVRAQDARARCHHARRLLPLGGHRLPRLRPQRSRHHVVARMSMCRGLRASRRAPLVRHCFAFGDALLFWLPICGVCCKLRQRSTSSRFKVNKKVRGYRACLGSLHQPAAPRCITNRMRVINYQPSYATDIVSRKSPPHQHTKLNETHSRDD